METGLFLVSVSSVWLATISAARACRQAGLPLAFTVLIPALLLYLASLVPGAVGLLSLVSAGAMAIALSIACMASLRRFSRSSKSAPLEPSATFSGTAWPVWLLVGCFFATALQAAAVVLTTSRGVVDRSTPLGWDTVSYHLPGFVEFLQNGTLWTMQGAYQSYHFGYELIANFPTYFSKGSWGVHLGHFLGLTATFLVLAELSRLLLELTPAGPTPGRWAATSLGAVTFWVYFFEENIRTVGKNDVFAMLCVLGSLVVALRRLTRTEVSSTLFAASSGALLGLAVATKPPALVYAFVLAPFFATMAPSGARIKASTAFTLAVVVIGGLWPLRNLVLLGDLSDPQLSILWTRTVWANLTDPAIYQPSRAGLLWIAGVVALLVLGLRSLHAPAGSVQRRGALLLSSFVFVGLAAFVVTPAGVEVIAERAFWMPRLAMAVFSLSGVILTAAVVDWLDRTPRKASANLAWIAAAAGALFTTWSGVAIPSLISWQALASLVLIAALAGLVSTWYRPSTVRAGRVAIAAGWIGLALTCGLYLRVGTQPVEGLPGQERFHGWPATGVYRWAQSLESPARFYASGLRPWGLYGHDLQNRVFYDLHAAPFSSPNGVNRLKRVLLHFQPDFVLTSLDPHTASQELSIPRLAWLESQPCFESAYRDETVAAFRVENECEDLLTDWWLPDSTLPRSSG